MTMRTHGGLILTMMTALALGGCASASTGGGAAAANAGPTTSATGKTYPPGTKPSESKFTTPAKLALAQNKFDVALQQAQQGIAADSTNPQHYFLAGQAYAGLQNYAAADSMFDVAERIYPAYEQEIEPARESAWAEAFNAGVNAYNAGNTDEAIKDWENANLIYAGRPESFQNLAAVYTQQEKYDQAVEAYQAGIEAAQSTPAARQLTDEEKTERAEALETMTQNLGELLLYTENFAAAEKLYRDQLAQDSTNVSLQAKLAAAIAAQPGREAEAQQMYSTLLGKPNLKTDDVMSIGVALFNSKNYKEAAQAFKRVADARPNSRDAWYNYANALYAGEMFEQLVPVAETLVRLDPLNENAALILANAYRETEQNQKALAVLEKNEALPVKVDDLKLQAGQGKVTVTGTVVGNKAAPGTPQTLRFTFYGDAGQLGTQTVTVNAPAAEQKAQFQVEFTTDQDVTGYSYQLGA
jgi:tetratricopeptide (TPR) repeat protein